ncbi:hypothetical protein D3C85_1330260 [compost metagenome]
MVAIGIDRTRKRIRPGVLGLLEIERNPAFKQLVEAAFHHQSRLWIFSEYRKFATPLSLDQF